MNLKITKRSPQVVLREIINWSGGQPFLTQKLCQLIVRTALETSRKIILPPETVSFWVEQFVRSHIIQHWESQDEPEHGSTIRDRLLFHEHRAGRLLGVYQQVLLSLENQTSGVSDVAMLRLFYQVSTGNPQLRGSD
jgi:hypothetical protein